MRVFHVRLDRGLLRSAELFNLGDAELARQVLEPWLAGQVVQARGRAWLPQEATLKIVEGPRLTTAQRSFGQGWLNASKYGEDVTEAVLTGQRAVLPGPDPRQVAVSYGRDEQARQAMFAFLEALGLRPLEWEALITATGQAMPYSGQAVEEGFAAAQAVVVLFTPDEVAHLHPDLNDSDRWSTFSNRARTCCWKPARRWPPTRAAPSSSSWVPCANWAIWPGVT